jgi:hypothetical protein
VNDWDRNNIDFLLALKGQGLTDWVDQASDDDMAYANELLARYKTELELECLDHLDCADLDTQPAVQYLSKFRL